MGSHQEYVPHHPKPEVVYDLPLNLQGLESAFAHCVEFASREIVLVQGGTCTVCWLDWSRASGSTITSCGRSLPGRFRQRYKRWVTCSKGSSGT